MRNLAKHGIASAVALIFAIVFYVNSYKLPQDAASLPRILAWLIILLALAMFAEAVYKERKTVNPSQDPALTSPESPEPQEPIHVFRVFVFAAFIVVYVALIEPLGYFLVTPVFVIGALAYLKSTKLWKSVLIALGFTAFCYFLFVAFLKLPIPMGLMS
ncbi:hypothetical protein Desor_3022 [Desulfosporosinus orientis DSM 765]|uniref:DUF1468 domain-containing protein n=1 Tax=Desulfosporosinus orientis (strain ATCC 19365 / DSM 765 / NCIMB 8382 / VKM B-1628 / Singapore I) TaxID=768706 RepID=G7WI96_DESOD|nr:tripartite tricarboxylate transporter TctB family protein [Desulfosporosinus orientis]AET68544.1 hypothetical protein Desor_3022 [Desulfosporosinus orientis DSM 765]